MGGAGFCHKNLNVDREKRELFPFATRSCFRFRAIDVAVVAVDVAAYTKIIFTQEKSRAISYLYSFASLLFPVAEV
jgi:hypothetical protein